MVSAMFIFFFNNPETAVNQINTKNSTNNDSSKTPIRYKTYTKNNISFKCPLNWVDYTDKLNYRQTTSFDVKTSKPKSTQVVNTNQFTVGVGDPDTVGYQNMTVPTTMMIISNTTNKIDNSNSKINLPWKTIENQMDTVDRLKKDIKHFQLIWDSSNNFTIDGEDAYEYSFQKYSSSSGMEYSKVVSFETKNSTDCTIYTIMCSAREPQIKMTSKIFDKMIMSIKINN
jgi:hypothetical protein